MAEPTTSTTAASAIVGLAAVNAFFAFAGVSSDGVFWAMCGAIFGTPSAPQMGRLRSILAHLVSVLASAKVGQVVAPHFFPAEAGMIGGISFVSGIVFYRVIGIAPDIIVRKLGALGGEKAQ